MGDKAASPEAAKEGSPSSSDDEEWTVLSDKKPEAEAVQIPIQVLDKGVAPVYPTLPAEESTTTSTPRNTTTSANETQDQGARHPPAGQEVDSGTSLGSLSAALMWSCLLETNPCIYLGASIGRAPTLYCH